jgi:hypothetical protein
VVRVATMPRLIEVYVIEMQEFEYRASSSYRRRLHGMLS